MDLLNAKENPVFASFMFYCAILFLKIVALVFCTIYQRMTNKVFSSPEDVQSVDPDGKKGLKIITNDPSVERVRRAHLNDMENIFPFFFLGIFYITTNPAASTAIMLFRLFTVSRVLHSIVYLAAVRQPARALCFLPNIAVNIYMAVVVFLHYM